MIRGESPPACAASRSGVPRYLITIRSFPLFIQTYFAHNVAVFLVDDTTSIKILSNVTNVYKYLLEYNTQILHDSTVDRNAVLVPRYSIVSSQSSYRSEILGLLGIIEEVARFCKTWKITQCSCVIMCDGISALERVQDTRYWSRQFNNKTEFMWPLQRLCNIERKVTHYSQICTC